MSDQSASARPNALTEPSGRWMAAHSRLLSGCLVTLNIVLVVLLYLCFWRTFRQKRADRASSSEDDDESSDATPPLAASARAWERREFDAIVASLPVLVHQGPGAAAGAAECAVCLAELRDGERTRLLPRCGHRFHVECVDVWFRSHATCPLCRASVAPTAAAAESKGGVRRTDTDSPV